MDEPGSSSDPAPAPLTSTEPRLSVVVPTIGRSELIRCVGSVVASATAAGVSTDVEIIVVWQGSADPPPLPETARVVPTFPAGVAYCRNKGLAESSAPLVAFIDDDEVADEGWVRAILDSFEGHDADALFGPVEALDDEGRAYCNYSGTDHRVFSSESTPPWVVGTEGNMAFRASALRDVGAFDLSFGIGAPGVAAEGADLIVRMLRNGRRIDFVPTMIVFHPTKNAEERLASRYPYGFGMGKVIRRHRAVVLGGKYTVAGLQNLGRGLRQRDSQRTREAIRTLRGFSAAAVRRTAWPAPLAHLDSAPDVIAAAIDGAPVRPLPLEYRGRPHFVYAVGDDRILHLYASPSTPALRAVREREVIRTQSTAAGVPRLLATATGPDALWALEERVLGTPPDPRQPPTAWFPLAVAWATAFAGEGPPLDSLDTWWSLRNDLLASVPASAAGDLEAALGVVGRLSAARVHGDFERKNLHVRGSTVAVIDWETAELHGLPGNDLLFLTATAAGPSPEPVLRALLRGEDPAFGRVLDGLARVGVDASTLPSVLLVVLARWRLQELERLSFPGERPAPRAQDELFSRLLPHLRGVHGGASPA